MTKYDHFRITVCCISQCVCLYDYYQNLVYKDAKEFPFLFYLRQKGKNMVYTSYSKSMKKFVGWITNEGANNRVDQRKVGANSCIEGR